MPLPSEKLRPRIVLTDPTLFGNDAAEDESEDVFYSYALERPEVTQFSDPRRRLSVARAYKGEGKSALLRLSRRQISRATPRPIVVARTATELSPEVGRDDYAAWVRAWKAAILAVFANEIGSQIGVAWSDDTMALVEEAEKSGFRKRSLLSAILDRLKLPEVNLGGTKVSAPERRVLGTVNPGAAVKRWAQGKTSLWLLVDDIDKNFARSPSSEVRVASFFDAVRELINAIPELRVRAVIRPNVWTIIKLAYESLSHVEQYILDLRWTEADCRQLLAKRIGAYLRRTNQGQWLSRLPRDDAERDKATIGFAFESPMEWGGSTRPPHVLLYTLSKHRPRWLIELSKVGATSAVRRQRPTIEKVDLTSELRAFGERRIEDSVAEFRSQCPELDELVAAFAREKEELSTDELLSIIDKKILSHLSPVIVGVRGRPSNLDVAALLFQIGLFYGRRDHSDGSYEHVTFSNRPTLFRARTNLDDGLKWEVHPVFRQALEMRDAEGRETRARRRE